MHPKASREFWRNVRRMKYYTTFWPAWKTGRESAHPNHTRARAALDGMEQHLAAEIRRYMRCRHFPGRRGIAPAVRDMVWELRALRAARRGSGI